MSDRKSTRLNSSHMSISYAVFCLKKKKKMYNEINLSGQLWINNPRLTHRVLSRRPSDATEMTSQIGSSKDSHHLSFFFFFNDTATTEIYTLSLHDALPI